MAKRPSAERHQPAGAGPALVFVVEREARLADCPTDACAGCAGVTCVINQSVARSLRDQVRQWLGDRE